MHVVPPDPRPGAALTAPRRAKHLLDFDNPRPRPSARRTMHIEHVQMWVLSVLAVTSILHMSAGVVLAAFYVDDTRLDAKIGLLVIGGIFGLLAVFAGRAIHRKRLLSWWLGLGVVPAAVGAVLLFGRA